jgi:predicted DNA-binding WGR domain protein
MKAKGNRRKKITREMIMHKFRVSSIRDTYLFRRWGLITND